MSVETLINASKDVAKFLRSVYADPSVTLRVREQCRAREVIFQTAIVEAEDALASTKPAKTTSTKKVKQEEVQTEEVNPITTETPNK